MDLTREFKDKSYYSVSEIMTITGMSRKMVMATFPMAKVGDFTYKKIGRESVRLYMDGKIVSK